MIGQNISHYQIVEKLGEGGMGVVYKARDTKLERTVALKFLPSHITITEEDKTRFILEAKAAAALNHPHICTIHAVDEHDGNQFIVMEYVDGMTLRERSDVREQTSAQHKPGTPPSLNSKLRRAGWNLEPETVIDYTLQIAEALSEAHEKGIVHRDIKPENIMVDSKNRIKVMDFGLAKIKSGTHFTKTRSTLGTLVYMSPEQVHGENVDHRTDLWALGVVMYEMLTGISPFQSEYEASIVYSILNEDPVPPKERNEYIPDEVSAIVKRLLQKNPDGRYQSADELLSDLRAHRSGEAPRPHKIVEKPADQSDTIPRTLTGFIGRARELKEMKDLLSSNRLLTLTGIGGTGKTRLAIQLSTEILSLFKDGVYFIDLSQVRDHGMVTLTIARSLKLKEVPGQPVIETLKSFLRDKQLLLILDNYEQVIAAAPVVSELIASAPHCKIIVTSRESLNIQGEQEYPVSPLSLPDDVDTQDIESLPRYESIALFVQRAQNVKPDFKLTVENAKDIAGICRRLEGLPLAIELAAARIKMLPPRALLNRLDSRLKILVGGAADQPMRLRTLRAAIEWSYDLLSDKEKTVFCRLSVFSGGFSFEAAEYVCNVPIPVDIDILDGLSSLVHKNLIKQVDTSEDEPRFVMLESIREFGMVCLRNNGELDTVRNAHRTYFAQLCKQAHGEMTGPDQSSWMKRFDEEHDNIHAALEWNPSTNDSIIEGLEMGRTLWRYWLTRGYFSEGRKWMHELISRANNDTESETLAEVLLGAGTLAHNNGDYYEAHRLISECLEMYRSLDIAAGIATTLNNLGWVAFRLGNYDEAHSLSEEGLGLHRKLHDKRGVAFSLNNLGWIAHHRGDFTRAQKYHEECLEIRRTLGDKRNIAFSLTNLAWSLQKQGQYTKAVGLIDEALGFFEEVGEQQLRAFALCIKADTLSDDGDLKTSYSLLTEFAIPLFRKIEDTWGIAYAMNSLGTTYFRQNNFKEASNYFTESLRLRNELGDRWGIAQALCNKGRAMLRINRDESAIDDIIKSFRLRRELGDKSGVVESLEALSEHYFLNDSRSDAFILSAIASSIRLKIKSQRYIDDGTIYSQILEQREKIDDSELEESIKQFSKIKETDKLLNLSEECVNRVGAH